MSTDEFPKLKSALTDGDIAFRQHTAGPNGPTFVTFAERYLGTKAEK